MALRSSLSSAGRTPRETRPVEGAAPSLGRRTGVTDSAPADEAPAPAPEPAAAPAPVPAAKPAPKPSPSPAATKKRGRPKRATAQKDNAPLSERSATQLRSDIKTAEADLKEVKARMNAALDKFRPELDKLLAQHAELSAALAKAMLK